MALPVVNEVEFFTTIPSTKQEIKFHPFTVKQQKALLLARESGEDKDIVNAVVNVLNDCIVEDLDVSKLASFDVQYLFLQIRGKSIGEFVEFKIPHYQNQECNHPLELSINFDDIKVNFPEGHSNKIQINDKYGMVLKYPSIVTMSDIDDASQVESNLKFISKSIEMVYDDEKVYDDFSEQEAYDFIMTLTTDQLDKILTFYRSLPSIVYDIEFDCPKCKQHGTLQFRSLADFFMLG